MYPVLPDTARASQEGHLTIAGCDAVELASRYGTPLLVLDRATFETRAKAYASVLDRARVYYAGKAFLCVAVCRLLEDLGLGLDACTGGELATAAAARFPAERIVFHGNNKSVAELEQARDAGVGRVVVDSFDEIERIAALGLSARLLIRVTPGVEAHTHEFVQTGQEDSKFGFTIGDVALEALDRARASGPEVVGVHAHIGSQIFEVAAFDLAVQRLAGFLAQARDEIGFEARELNLGGGLGIAHTNDELAPDPAESARRIVASVERQFSGRRLPVPEVSLEPGRSIVGGAVVTLYEVGTVKRLGVAAAWSGGPAAERGGAPSVDKVFVAVDGGMGDNIRPPLYGAKYEAFLANRMTEPARLRADVVGKFCESGDYLVKNAHLPADVRPGDFLCVPASGAYTYSMASNYNRVPRPAVVMVEDGKAVEVIRRETHEDLLRLDRDLER